MKKIGIIALLAVFLFNSAGYYLVFLAERMEIRNEIRSEINAGNYNDAFISVLTVSKAELASVEFYENGQEMRHNGEMYDIVRSTESANEITYYCINDSKESSLYTTIGNHIDNHVANKPAKDNGSKKLVDDIVKIWFPTENTFHFYPSVGTAILSPVKTDYLSAERQKSTPPPPEFC